MALVLAFGVASFGQDAKPFHFEKDVQNYEKASAANPPTDQTTFFVGSSTFTIWKEIPEDFAEYNAVNRGFGGSQISDWLDVAADRLLTPYKPRRIVFFCGCNDIAAGKSSESVFADFNAFVEKMRAANPDVVIHFCALHMPPVREKHWQEFRKYNEAVEELAKSDPNIYYVDFASATSDDKGAGLERLFQKDRLHLTREGEKVLIPLIKASITREVETKIKAAIVQELEAKKKNEVFLETPDDAFLPPGPTKNYFNLSSVDFETSYDDVNFMEQKATVSLGAVELCASPENGSLVLSLTKKEANAPFAQTRFALDDVQGVSVVRYQSENLIGNLDVAAVVLRLKNGWTLVFSDVHALQGFVAIEYRAPVNARLKNEEPATWELIGFDPAKFDSLKAFGTAGLKPVDGHKGSYAFLSIVNPETRTGVVGGWISSEKAGGVVRSGKSEASFPTYTPRLDYGDYQNDGRCFGERFVIGAFDDCRLGLEKYADAIAQYYSIEPNQDALVGYCTWYSEKHGGACDENSMKELTKALVEDFGDFGLQYVQIDDKWQLGASKNGPNKDFTAHNPKGPYPSGMASTSQFLNANSLVAGLWFMPFSGNFDDPYWADKQDLFVRSAIDYPEEGEKNTRRYSSINQKKDAPYETFWGGTSLDMSNPKAREYTRSLVDRITQDWNYKYIKIDGMWVGAGIEQLYVNDEYLEDDMGKQIFFDQTRTNVENFRAGLQTVRDAAKGTFILGCNVSQNMRVLASSYGLVDAMRVGPDNGASWDGVCAGPWRGTNRYFYNGRVWWNDPDPVYARKSIPIERARVSATWASISGQLFALSDWVPDYDEARIDLVRKTIPNHLKTNVRPVDLFDADLARVWLLTDDASGVRRDVLALFNWRGGDDEPFEFTSEKLGLPIVDANGNKIEKYVAYNFWDDEFVEPFDVFKTTLAKESCKVFAIRPVGDRPVLLSTSRHITQGVLEVKEESWNEETKTLTIVADVPEKLVYELRVYNPATGKLDKFAVPKGSFGVKKFAYRIDDAGEGLFEIVE